MTKISHSSKPSRLVVSLLALFAVATSAHAANGTWNSDVAAQLWSTAGDWVGSVIADGAGSTADFSQLNITGTRAVTIDGAVASRTVGVFLIGDTNTTAQYSISASGGGTLTFDNSGSGAALTQSATSFGDTFTNLPFVLADNLTVTNNSAAKTLSFAGTAGTTSTGGARTLTFNATSGGVINWGGASSLNHTGTIVNASTGPANVTISAAVGSNVTAITQSSNTSTFTFTGTLTANSGGTTLTNNSTANKLTVGAVNGTGDLILNNTTALAQGVSLSGTVNNAGAIINSGTGSGTAVILASGGVGSNVTAITQNSATSGLTVSGAITVNSAGTTFTSNAAKIISVGGAVSGTGDLILKNNSTLANGISFTSSINNIGAILNSGTGTGSVSISAAIGTNVTGVTQNSASSTLILSGANTYTGATTVSAGTLLVSGTGSINASSGISVSTGATIQNSNGASVTPALTLAEGSAVSTSGVGSAFAPTGLTLSGNLSNGWTAVSLTASAGGSGLTKGGGLTLTLSGLTAGTYNLTSGTGFSGSFTSANVNGTSLTASGADFTGTVGSFSYIYTNATNVLQLTAVPEPSTWALLAGSLTVVSILRRRRRL